MLNVSNKDKNGGRKIKICFFEMDCWKCGALNHVYYAYPIDYPYASPPEPEEVEEDALWNEESLAFQPVIRETVNNFLVSESGKDLRVGAIKPRYSKTMEETYLSFGCYQCDSIFGDFYVMEAMLEARYEEDKLKSFEMLLPAQG